MMRFSSIILMAFVGAALAQTAGNETCEASLLQRLESEAANDRALLSTCTYWCGDDSQNRNMCVNGVGDGRAVDEKIYNIADTSWEDGCPQCANHLEARSLICQGWKCVNKGGAKGEFIVRADGTACPQWDGWCANVLDYKAEQDDAVNKCAHEMALGDKNCGYFLISGECDKYCGLCACNTAGHTIYPEHCSGHGTCEADCSGKFCSNARCVCEVGYSGPTCNVTTTSTSTEALVFAYMCNGTTVGSCSDCEEQDCTDDCFWDVSSCKVKVHCGRKFATSCGECGGQFDCYGSCFWDGTSCSDPLDPKLRYSCGATHRSDFCEDCIDRFKMIDQSWATYSRAGCQGDCFYNIYSGGCQAVEVSTPTTIHHECPIDSLAQCESHTKESSPSGDVDKYVTMGYQIALGLYTTYINYDSSYSELNGKDKAVVKPRVFKMKTSIQVLNVISTVVRALQPTPSVPCSSKYDEDEYFLCIWDGLKPFVEQYVEEEMDKAQVEDYQAMLFGVITQLQELVGNLRNALGVYDVENLIGGDNATFSDDAFDKFHSATLNDLESIHHYMQVNAGHLLKDNAPWSQVIYLTFWALVHTTVMWSLMRMDEETYTTEAYRYLFATLIKRYINEIELRAHNAHQEREGYVHVEKTECEKASGTFAVTCRHTCQSCTKEVVLRDDWSKCTWTSNTMKVNTCISNCCRMVGTGCDDCCQYGTTTPNCGVSGGSAEACDDSVEMCGRAHKNTVMRDADMTWFDFSVAHLPSLRMSVLLLTDSWPGAHQVSESPCPTGDASFELTMDTDQVAKAICCTLDCAFGSCDGSTCSGDSMSYHAASQHCKDQGMQICSAYELGLRKCCGVSCSGKVWTRTDTFNASKTFTSEEPCMITEPKIYQMIPYSLMMASQSSTKGDGDASKPLMTPPEPIWPGSCSQTAVESKRWWKVTLKGNYQITGLKLTNRADCCHGRLQNIDIYVGGIKCASNVDVPGKGSLSVDCIGQGTEIQVRPSGSGEDSLTLCGFEAYGAPISEKEALDPRLKALGKLLLASGSLGPVSNGPFRTKNIKRVNGTWIQSQQQVPGSE